MINHTDTQKKFPAFHPLPEGGIGGQFLHGVDLSNDLLVHNLGIAGRLWTADYVGKIDPGLAETYRAIGDIPIDELASDGPYGNVLSPRSSRYFIPAAILDRGQTIVNGYGEPLELSDGRKMRIIETRDIELAFEDGRRQFAPKSPSRLSCIWLAENSSAGRAVIRSMLPKAFIASVRVQICTGITVADASWFDDYLNAARPEFIRNYWTGVVHPRISLPEILVDGIVQFTESEQLDYIKKHGAKFPLSAISGSGG